MEIHLQQSTATLQQVAQQCCEDILRAADIITSAFQDGKKLLLCGNGGSAADCQHMAAEFVSRLTKEVNRPGLPAIALTTDTSFLTAFANDDGFDGVFARQVQALGKQNDVLLAMSTSGNSKNVLNAVVEAKAKKMQTIALTGKSGELASLADVAICIPESDTQHVQEAHLVIEHILCDLVEYTLFHKDQ